MKYLSEEDEQHVAEDFQGPPGASLRFAEARGSEASACDSRIAKPKEQWCLKGHSAICDTLCKLWCCKHEHQQALLAPPPSVISNQVAQPKNETTLE